MTNNKSKINKVIIILLIVWLLFSFFTFFYFKKVCTIARENPLKYGAKEYNLESCYCLTRSGEDLFFNQTNVQRMRGIDMTLPKISGEKED